MTIMWGEPRRLGVAGGAARLGFGVDERRGRPGLRVLELDGEPAFELSHWCGTCPFLFRRLEGANETLSADDVQELLGGGLDGVDERVVAAFGALLPEGEYLPVLLRVEPQLVNPGKEGDYFSGEQVATWGMDQFWGLPQYPHTPYYRTFETGVDASAHLYEFVVPMVPPRWNTRARVEEYARLMADGTVPTAVAVSTLDVCEPASGEPEDHYRHWGLTHFLLDGHHKLEAAASTGHPVRLLSFLALDQGLATPEEHARLPGLRSRTRSARQTIA
ncbi:hypothetical protein ACWCYY_12755 [Kitasatospora sp. NPDC001664]|uniref:hypothetical protein n=1 Tax=Kitasatospora albolonga TaxID=68173 RepID=UPI0035E8ABBC